MAPKLSKEQKAAKAKEDEEKLLKQEAAETKKRERATMITTLKHRIKTGSATAEDAALLADYEGRSRLDADKAVLVAKFFKEGKSSKWYSNHLSSTMKEDTVKKGVKRGYGTVCTW